ncbi:hypothetical protein Glove_67g100 [Diversispora epigaea]|uniref:Uncharacterized protein n=1 Tax=Diversispora epigaea TaxID=1348612 RepID=A0A397JHA4_9GLOM|nr:hypothetical protein Glove_67g100 [Diversispora epigaea]
MKEDKEEEYLSNWKVKGKSKEMESGTSIGRVESPERDEFGDLSVYEISKLAKFKCEAVN